jgi:malate synthase
MERPDPAGPSLMFVRNVGHLMTTPAARLADGIGGARGHSGRHRDLPDLAARHQGAGRRATAARARSTSSSPRCTGRTSAAFTNDLFDAVEDLLGCRHTIKVGVMDEERRTSANLKACIHAVKDRVVFINTGFLDRTGDEIHTSMQAGADDPQGRHEVNAAWIKAYEDRNVAIGLACGLSGKAQIGKGMWAAPDRMADMLDQKIGHPKTGANTAWVPSPTAATLHATHYHKVDVFARAGGAQGRSRRPATRLLSVPVAAGPNWTSESRDPATSSTTMRRASSAMSCAGSTRASAAPRCPTSTTSA